MIRYLLAATVVMASTPFQMQGQGTMVILVDTYQDQSNFIEGMTEQITMDAKALLNNHQGSSIGHFCHSNSPDYFAIGHERIVEQLDSVARGQIAEPPTRFNWNNQSITRQLMNFEFAIDFHAVELHLFTVNQHVGSFRKGFLDKFAHVFDLFSESGELIPSVQVTLHSYTSANSIPEVTTITSVR